MMKKSVQNKNTSSYYKISLLCYVLLALSPLIGIIIGLFLFIPVYADSLNDISEPYILPSDGSSVTVCYNYSTPFSASYTGSVPCYVVITQSEPNSNMWAPVYFFDGSYDASGLSLRREPYSYSPSLISASSQYGLSAYDGYAITSNNWSSSLAPIVPNFAEACALVRNSIDSSVSVTATIIPSSSWLYLGTNSNNQSVYIQSAVLNDSAVCFYQDSTFAPGFIPAVVSKNNYGVIYRVAGVETSLSSSELVVDGVTWYSKYTSSLDFVVTTPNPDIGVASSSVSADNACIDAINSAYPSDGRANLLYYLPGGNVAYTLLSEYSDVALLQISSPSVISSSDFSSFNVRYGWASELPSSAEDITTVSLSLLDPVLWTPSGPTDILGRSSMAQSYIDTSGHAGDYFVVFNPFAHGFSSSSDNITEEYVNPDIMINVTQIAGQKIFGVDSAFNPATGDYSYIGNGKIWDKDMSSPGNVYVDNEGKITNPEQGGGSNSNPVTNFWTWLNGKFEELKNLFSTGHSMIQNLVGYGSDFMTSVQKLYTWLPDPVYSVLSSALVLVIIIGVVKCFL